MWKSVSGIRFAEHVHSLNTHICTRTNTFA